MLFSLQFVRTTRRSLFAKRFPNLSTAHRRPLIPINEAEVCLGDIVVAAKKWAFRSQK